jgi:hypothetical protein
VIDPTYAAQVFDYLYGNIKGYEISNNARSKFSGSTEKLLYGELPFDTWKKIVEFANPNQRGVFFDLGSGTGRVVMQSHLLFDFKKSIGVEILDGLHEKACEVKENFDRTIKPQIQTHVDGREIKFIKDSFFNVSLQEADLIFMNHPFKEGEDFLRLEEKFLNELKPGTKIVTIIRALKSPAFKYLGKQTFKFSWGDSTAHFCEV